MRLRVREAFGVPERYSPLSLVIAFVSVARDFYLNEMALRRSSEWVSFGFLSFLVESLKSMMC